MCALLMVSNPARRPRCRPRAFALPQCKLYARGRWIIVSIAEPHGLRRLFLSSLVYKKQFDGRFCHSAGGHSAIVLKDSYRHFRPFTLQYSIYPVTKVHPRAIDMSTDARTSQSDTTVTSLATSTSPSNPTSTPTEVSVYTWYTEVGDRMRPHGAFRNLPGTAEFNHTFG